MIEKLKDINPFPTLSMAARAMGDYIAERLVKIPEGAFDFTDYEIPTLPFEVERPVATEEELYGDEGEAVA